MVCFWRVDYPLLLAKEYRTLIFAFVFFTLSAFIGAFSAAHDDSFVRLILGDSYVNMTLENIEEGKPMGVYGSLGEWEMFLFITFNNIKVAFIAFAFGIFFSAGTLWVLFPMELCWVLSSISFMNAAFCCILLYRYGLMELSKSLRLL